MDTNSLQNIINNNYNDKIVGGIKPTQILFFFNLKININIIINNNYNDDIVGRIKPA